MTLRRAVLVVVALVVTLALIPVGLIVRTEIHDALDARMRDDLSRAPRILADRWAAIADVRMMHARDLSVMDGLPAAVERGDTREATRILTDGVAGFPEVPELIDAEGRPIVGSTLPDPALVDQTRAGGMPVSVVPGESGLHLLALAPVMSGGRWVGAAGGSTPIDAEEARTLAGLTRTEVMILGPDGGVSGSSLPLDRHTALGAELFALMRADTVSVVRAEGAEYLTTSGELPGGAKVFFLRDVEAELAILPAIQTSILLASAGVLALALLVGWVFSGAVARPVSSLADAADRFRAGDDRAPVPGSGLRDVERLSAAFGEMRERLAARLRDLEAANVQLEDRQRRLASLQAELVQRERRLATGQLVGQLAHEIRNPIASIRNCLEVILREVEGSGRPEEFTRLAIDELLRMHELAEQMLAMNRPDAEPDPCCDPVRVAREVARLVSLGDGQGEPSVVGESASRAALPQDGLKQVLLNLVLNAREAAGDGPVEILVDRAGSEVRIRVLDRGEGIDEALLGRIFDPFFTTKSEVKGVGLGLFLAEAIVRRYGGSISATNRSDGPGACFTVTVPIRAAGHEGSESAIGADPAAVSP